MKSLRKKLTRINPEASYITIEELYNEYEFELGYDESKECFYIEDPESDDYLDFASPCFQNIYDLEKWINEHWDTVQHFFVKRQEGEAEEEDAKRQEGIARIRLLKEAK